MAATRCRIITAFQFYPKGAGGLNKREDPVDHHQLSATILHMSTRGRDFTEGGAYVERENGELVMLDDLAGPGDLIHTNAQVNHGVLPIDPGAGEDWLSFEGRRRLLFATDKLHENQQAGYSVDLGAR